MDTTAVQRALVALGYSLVVDGKPRSAADLAIAIGGTMKALQAIEAAKKGA